MLFGYAEAQKKVSISGYIREKSSGEMLSGATIYLYPSKLLHSQIPMASIQLHWLPMSLKKFM